MRCKALIEDADLNEAFEAVRSHYLEAFAGVRTDDIETMKAIRARLEALENVKTDLHQAIKNGSVEEFNVEQTTKHRKWMEWTTKR